MEDFTVRVIKIIKNIPLGKVMTYGQIARLAGSPRAARQVVRILHSMSEKYHLPWHRVINSKGLISIKPLESSSTQKEILRSEGIKVLNDDSINLEWYQFYPDLNDMLDEDLW